MSDKETRKFLAKKLKELRIEAGYTAKDVGDKIGKNAKTVSGWEHERGQPDTDILNELAKLYNCSIDYLLGRSETRVDDTLLDTVNVIPGEMLGKYGNILDAQRAYQAQIATLDTDLISLLVLLSPDEVMRVRDFVAGLIAARAK